MVTMAYFVALASAFPGALGGVPRCDPGRRGLFAALAYPVGWAAGELPGLRHRRGEALLGLLLVVGLARHALARLARARRSRASWSWRTWRSSSIAFPLASRVDVP